MQSVPSSRLTLQEIYQSRAQRLPDAGVYYSDYAMMAPEPTMECSGTVGVRNLEETPLQRTFFSSANIRIIQNAIRYQVWQRSGEQHVISPQSENELRIVMQAIFVNYSRNQPDCIPGQIAELNDKVVSAVVPKILSEVDSYMKYLADASTPMNLQERPLCVNSAGTKNLEWGRSMNAFAPRF